MKNKVLINVYVPSIDYEYEVYVPVNETISKVIDLIVKSIQDISEVSLPNLSNYCLLDPDTSKVYDYGLIIRDTNIVNNKKVILF